MFFDDVIGPVRTELRHCRALFNSVSAHQPYGNIVRETLQPVLVLKLASTVGASLFDLTSDS